MGKPAAVATGLTQCSFGVTPAALDVIPTGVLIEGKPAATIMDSTIINIPTFGMCNTLSNPVVAAATAAKLGVFTPMPCVPVLTPWIPVSMTLITGQPALVEGCTCICAYGGVVEFAFVGTTKTMV